MRVPEHILASSILIGLYPIMGGGKNRCCYNIVCINRH